MGDGRSVDEKLAPQDFVADFIWAARAVFSQPSVALVSMALWCLSEIVFSGPHMNGTRGLLGAAVALFTFGWFGAERLFFLRRREGQTVTLDGLFGATRRFIGRFLRLACLVGSVMVPVVFVSGYVAGRIAAHSGAAGNIRVVFAVIFVLLDLVLTFVPSALVFTTRSARQALRIGLGMIRQTWPRSGLYVLCPPLALNLLNSIYPTSILAVRLSTTAGLALLALLAKGATAAFYLRERPASPDVVASAL
jgi:hypothetical protein